MKALVGPFNQEKALVGAFSVIVKTDCETDGSFLALASWNTFYHFIIALVLFETPLKHPILSIFNKMDVNNVNIENEAIDRTIPFFICFYIVREDREEDHKANPSPN